MSKIYIIGGANVDLHGIPTKKMKLQDSNPGKVTYSFGGVARNIAENLAKLGNDIVFISAFGNDPYGQRMFKYCESLGIDLSKSIVSNDFMTSTYMAMLDNDHDMLMAIADMDILDLLTVDYLKEIVLSISKDDILILDTNLKQEVIKQLVLLAKCPIYLDPISSTKALKVKSIIGKFTMIKPNSIEAEVLSDLPVKGKQDYRAILEYFINKGCKEVIISLGKNGVIASDSENYLWIYHPYQAIVNATGAGDSFIAAYIDASLKKKTLLEKVQYAVAASMLTVSCLETVHPNMSSESIQTQLKKVDIKGETIC